MSSAWDFGNFRTRQQIRLSRACAYAQSRQSLCCWHTQNAEVDEASPNFKPLSAHSCLKSDFTHKRCFIAPLWKSWGYIGNEFSHQHSSQDKLFRNKKAVRNFSIPSKWSACPVHVTSLSSMPYHRGSFSKLLLPLFFTKTGNPLSALIYNNNNNG